MLHTRQRAEEFGVGGTMMNLHTTTKWQQERHHDPPPQVCGMFHILKNEGVQEELDFKKNST